MPGRDALRAFCVFGLLTLILGGTAYQGTVWDKASDWRAFALIGAGLLSIPALRLLDARLQGMIGGGLGWLGLVALLCFSYRLYRPVAAVGALAFLVPVLGVRGVDRAWWLHLILVLACWMATVTLTTIPTGSLELLAGRGTVLHPLFVPVAVVASALVAASLFGAPRARVRRRWLDALAVVPIALASARSDYLFDAMGVHHWGAYLGAARVVRHGGWLLWDTPSQYGFLSTLAIAAMPWSDLWQAFFVLNVMLLAVSGLALFVVLRTWSGALNCVFALAVVLASLLWLPGWGGALATPSAGPMRFVWCQLLLVLLWRHAHAPSARLLAVGTALWVVGCLWSAESLFYCSLAWLPAYAWLAWRGQARPWTPPAALAAAVTLVVVWYGVRLGHLPDPRAFTEYVVAFQRFYAGTMEPEGAVWILILVVALCGTALWFDASPLTLALTAASWAVASYFVGNCNDVTVTNLLAVLGTVIAILGDVALRRRAEAWSVVVRLGAGVLVAGLLVLDPLANRWLNADALAPDSYRGGASARRPWIDQRIVGALHAAGARDGDPVMFLFVDDPGEGFAWIPWLPFGSLVTLVPMPEARQEEYAARWLARHPAPVGWLVDRVRDQQPSPLRGLVARGYRAAQVVERDEYRVTRYERVGGS